MFGVQSGRLPGEAPELTEFAYNFLKPLPTGRFEGKTEEIDPPTNKSGESGRNE